MISSICIQNFRGFKRFEMADLGRVNLLVGGNNSGKTSLLEALYLLTSKAEPRTLWDLLWHRGENAINRTPYPERHLPEVDASHLFSGHKSEIGSRFLLSAQNQTPRRSLEFIVEELTKEERDTIKLRTGEIPKVGLRITGTPSPRISLIPLGSSGTISSESLDVSHRLHRPPLQDSNVQYVTTDVMDGNHLVSMWNTIALTPDEELVLNALGSIDSKIERIATQTDSSMYWEAHSRAGFIIKHKDFENPIPIGSMGDGIWRLFSLAIAITQCRGGVLLVDEIDTGLHYSVMYDMWKLIISAAKMFDVQVFATTHSSDCIKSLADNASDNLDYFSGPGEVTLQRIEQDRWSATYYSSNEMHLAAERLVEVR